MRNILVTDFGEDCENVMIFTNTLTVGEVTKRLDEKEQSYNEIYEVPTKDLGYYIYDPCHIEA